MPIAQRLFCLIILVCLTGTSSALFASSSPFAGFYSGLFAGDDLGNFYIRVAPDGTLTGKAFSVFDVEIFDLTGSVDLMGTINFGNISNGASFTGSISAGEISGTWMNTITSDSGSFSAQSSGSPIGAAGEYAGSISGSIKGSFTATAQNDGNISGNAKFSGLNANFIGLVDGSGFFFAVAAGEILISGVVFNGFLVGSIDDESSDTLLFGSRKGGPITIPVANITANPAVALLDQDPVTITFNGSGSKDGIGAIIQYEWDFGDGNSATTTSPITTNDYTQTGEFIVSLVVITEEGEISLPRFFSVVIGEGRAGDTQLFTSKLKYGVNFKKANSDFFSFTGVLNPRGLGLLATGANAVIKINGTDITAMARSTEARNAGAGASFKLSTNGTYNFSIKGVSLANALGVSNANAKEQNRMRIEMVVDGVPLSVTSLSNVLETDLDVKAGSSAKGSFSFIPRPTVTGVFKALKADARQAKTGDLHAISASGPLQGELGIVVIPTGDITVSIGNVDSSSTFAMTTIALSTLTSMGRPNLPKFTYNPKAPAANPAIRKFSIDNAKKSFILQTAELAETGIPLAGDPATSNDMQLIIMVPVAEGELTFTTTLGLKRTNANATTWKN